MKKTSIKTNFLMLAFAASLLCLCTPAIADEEDEVGETIVINPEEYHNQGGHNRAPVFIPFGHDSRSARVPV